MIFEHVGDENVSNRLDGRKMSVCEEFHRLKDVCYLDHVGATLYSEEQIRQVTKDLCNNVYGNPHSGGVISKSTLDAIDQVRYQVLQHFNTTPEDYSIIFTSGATASLKLVADSFDFSNDERTEKGVFAYAQECHTSVLGMREIVAERSSSVIPLPQLKLKELLDYPKTFQKKRSYKASSNSLFVYSGQCNFSGLKNPLEWIDRCHQGACSLLGPDGSRWHCLLDAASLVPNTLLDLSAYKPDFVVLSFYKIMGYPTGLGALIVRNSSAHTLKKTYFGGGTVFMALSGKREHTLRPLLHDRFEDGTLPFLSILAVRTGLDTIPRLRGDMNDVQRHTFELARRTFLQMKNSYHSNGAPLFKFYCDTNFSDANTQGSTINFNLLRHNGDYVGYSEVLHMANLHEIHLRVGCFCNPGACQRHLGLTDEDIRAHFEAGHVCGDGVDIVHGQPTGSVRISFGYMSTEADSDKFLSVMRSCFTKIDSTNNKNIFEFVEDRMDLNIKDRINLSDTEDKTFKLTQIVVFPVKSCGGFYPADRWSIGSKGLHYDRVWMVVGGTGSVLTQKNEPKLALVKPYIDLKKSRLRLSFPGRPDCWVPLNETPSGKNAMSSFCQSKVCEDRVRGQDCGIEVSNWLSSAIGKPGLRLIRQLDDDQRVAQGDERSAVALANIAQFLLINEASVEWLWDQLPPNDDCAQQGLLDRFRANLVVQGREPFEEMTWNKVLIGNEVFEIIGPCTRCSIICVDQATGRRTREPLRTLSETLQGRVKFGIYLSHSRKPDSKATISTKDNVCVELWPDSVEITE